MLPSCATRRILHVESRRSGDRCQVEFNRRLRTCFCVDQPYRPPTESGGLSHCITGTCVTRNYRFSQPRNIYNCVCRAMCYTEMPFETSYSPYRRQSHGRDRFRG